MSSGRGYTGRSLTSHPARVERTALIPSGADPFEIPLSNGARLPPWTLQQIPDRLPRLLLVSEFPRHGSVVEMTWQKDRKN